MWYKNIADRFFELVTKHACERIRGCTTMRYINLRFTYLLTYLRTDRITTAKTALAQRRAVKSDVTVTIFSRFIAEKKQLACVWYEEITLLSPCVYRDFIKKQLDSCGLRCMSFRGAFMRE